MSSFRRRRRLELHSRRVGGVFIEIYLISIVAVIRRLISIVLVCLGTGGEFLRRGGEEAGRRWAVGGIRKSEGPFQSPLVC